MDHHAVCFGQALSRMSGHTEVTVLVPTAPPLSPFMSSLGLTP
jgi:hypothetical protein